MNIREILMLVFQGAAIGCLVLAIVEIMIAMNVGMTNFVLNGQEILNYTIGTIIVGQAFVFSGLIYKKEDLSLLTQTTIQMIIGFTTLIIVGIYLKWIPINLGIGPIITFLIIGLVFAFVMWGAYYLYFLSESKKINEKIKN